MVIVICDGIERNQLVIVANAKPGSELTSEPIKMFFVSFSADIGLFFFLFDVISEVGNYGGFRKFNFSRIFTHYQAKYKQNKSL